MTNTQLCRLYAADMVRRGCRGHILNMSSYSLWMPFPGLSLYSASKAYLRAFSVAFAKEVREHGIRVTAVCPAGVATDLYGLTPRWQRIGQRLGGAHLGRLLRPARAARPVAGTPHDRPRLVEPHLDPVVQDAADVGDPPIEAFHHAISEIRMDNIKNVVFDLGGVLVDLDIDRCKAAFRSLGMEAVAQLINSYYPAEMIGRLERGEISFHEACEEMRRLSGRADIPDERIAWAYGKFLTGVSATKLRAIERLRNRGLKSYVLSNNNPASMEVIRRMFRCDGHAMEHYFDRIYLSYELRELKPSEAIFRKMIDDSGMVPAETLVIDDGQRNVEAARQMGFAVYMPAPGEDFTHLLESLCEA